MKNNYDKLVEKALEMGATGAKLIDPQQVVFDPRSHFKCRFGCKRWGRHWTCPPHVTLTQEQFDEAFARYQAGLIIQSPGPKQAQEITLAMEKQAMLEHKSLFALALVMCVQCAECAYPEPCLFPHLARPSMDCYGMDISATVESLGFKVAFDTKGESLPAWYSMVLLD